MKSSFSGLNSENCDRFRVKLPELNKVKLNVMKRFVFIDMLTGDTFFVECEPYKIHNVELWDKDFAEWCKGRVLKRDE